MKFILVIVSMFISGLVFAQTDTTEDEKPSWSSKLPDRNDAPEMSTEDDEEIGELKIDRSSLFGNEDEESDLVTEDESDSTEDLLQDPDQDTSSQQAQTDAAEIAAQEEAKKAEQEAQAAKEAEAARIATQEAEAARIATQEADTAKKVAQEAEAEKKAQQEADNIANQKKLAEEQARAEEKSALEQKQSVENITSNPDSSSEVRPYTWKKIKNVAPEYPIKAARSSTEGWVDVEFTIDNSGRVVGAHPIKTFKNLKVFNKAALRAVRQWKFDPPINYGIKLNQTKSVRVVFNLAK